MQINSTDTNGNNIIFHLLELDLEKELKIEGVLLNTIKNLIVAGVDINTKNDRGITALEFAILNDKDDILKLLLDLRARYKFCR
ncbi:hypothetical protein MASR2M54_18540 [Aliarcobacter cryaerophilus]